MKRRILAIDGGGLRGVIAIAFLERLETMARTRRGKDFRLVEMFDLVGGTSTGAIIATALALGRSVSEIRDIYFNRVGRVFRSTWDPMRLAGLRPRFDAALLEKEIEIEVGDVTLGSAALLTRLAIVVKRLDSGAPWIVSNVPTAPYYDDPPDGQFRGNRHFRLSRLLRASTAVPSLFDPVFLQIRENQPEGLFIDGGFSPHNDPSLLLLMLARMSAYGLNWPSGTENLLIVSLGTGEVRARVSGTRARKSTSLAFAARSLSTLVVDGAAHTRTLMNWLGEPFLPRPLNSEIGDLAAETPGLEPLFSYLRLNAPLEAEGLAGFGIDLSPAELRQIRSLVRPEAMPTLYRVASAVAEQIVVPELFDRL